METRLKQPLDGFRKSVLEAHGMDFLIVGSLALHELGMETAEPHDIDMEVNVHPNRNRTYSSYCRTLRRTRCIRCRRRRIITPTLNVVWTK